MIEEDEMTKSILLILIVSIFSFSCTDSSIEPPNEIDKSLIGTWYYKIIDNTIEGPKEFIYGIKIELDGLVTQQTIQTSTGKLTHIEKIGRVLNTVNHKMELQRYYSNPLEGYVEYSQEIAYVVDDETLNFIDEKNKDIGLPFYKIYSKTSLFEELAKPTLSYFKILRNISNGTKYYIVNKPISPAPSAYSFKRGNSLIIVANSDQNFYNIEITNFSGVGNYGKNNTKVLYEWLNGDIVERLSSENNPTNVDLNITSYEENQEVSGKLELNIKNQHIEFVFTNGEFIVPIY